MIAAASPPALAILTGPDEAALDHTARPCDDFYEFACGSWTKATTIPPDEASWTRSFSVVSLDNQKALRAILERDAAGDTRGDPYGDKLGDYWASCMDEDGIEQRGLVDLVPHLERIDTVHDATSLAVELARLQAIGVNAGFGIGSEPDMKDASRTIAAIAQGGLGLPDRDYYVRADPRSKALRAAYEQHVAATFRLIGDSAEQSAAEARTVLTMETDLARASMRNVELRDPYKIYHLTTLPQLERLAPNVSWDAYLEAVGFPKITTFNVGQPNFFRRVSAMVRSVPLRAWKTYLRWHLMRAASPYLPRAFVDEWFAFVHMLTGAQTLQPRWRRCVRIIDRGMGEALARPFVEQHLGADGKRMAEAMVDAIETSMRDDLDAITWMDDPTRVQAQAKLAAVTNQIGYPSKWRNYDALAIQRGRFLSNVFAADAFETARQLAKADKPTDKQEWAMTPPTVNAYYEPTLNEMVFPAGILQPPFYAKTQAPAMNYGAIGTVVGHELTHGFDDEGRRFDGDGNLRDWWTAPVSEAFDRRVACVEHQFDQFVVEGEHVDGQLTLGEAVADLGGLRLSYSAFERTLESPGRPKPRDVGGFTPLQEFFLGFAQIWCANYRPEAMRLLVATNPHPPPAFRVNAPLSNMPGFASAFACEPGDPMVRPEAQRCAVW